MTKAYRLRTFSSEKLKSLARLQEVRQAAMTQCSAVSLVSTRYFQQTERRVPKKGTTKPEFPILAAFGRYLTCNWSLVNPIRRLLT